MVFLQTVLTNKILKKPASPCVRVGTEQVSIISDSKRKCAECFIRGNIHIGDVNSQMITKERPIGL